MEQEQQKPPPEPAREVPDDPRVVAHRCPFCHEPVRPDAEAWVACARCLGRKHTACWDEAGRCAACRHERRLEAGDGQPPRPRAGAVGAWLLAAGLVLSLGVGWFLLSLVTFAPRQHVTTAPAPDVRVEPIAAEPAPPRAAAAPGVPSAPARPNEARVGADVDDAEVERQEDELDPRERARVEGAAPRPEGEPTDASTQAPFTWIPDDPALADVARRLVREHRERALEREGEVGGLVLLAHADLYAGNPEAAVARVERALDQDPRHGPAWTVRGWARLALGDLRRARLDLERGERLSHDPTWALVGLGRVAEQRGERARARALYERALEVGGERLVTPVDHASDLRRRVARLER